MGKPVMVDMYMYNLKISFQEVFAQFILWFHGQLLFNTDASQINWSSIELCATPLKFWLPVQPKIQE